MGAGMYWKCTSWTNDQDILGTEGNLEVDRCELEFLSGWVGEEQVWAGWGEARVGERQEVSGGER